jgi:hypothetical protein
VAIALREILAIFFENDELRGGIRRYEASLLRKMSKRASEVRECE